MDLVTVSKKRSNENKRKYSRRGRKATDTPKITVDGGKQQPRQSRTEGWQAVLNNGVAEENLSLPKAKRIPAGWFTLQ